MMALLALPFWSSPTAAQALAVAQAIALSEVSPATGPDPPARGATLAIPGRVPGRYARPGQVVPAVALRRSSKTTSRQRPRWQPRR
jgi:hypothetical protein